MRIGKILKGIFIALIVAVFAIILIRIFMLDDKSTLDNLYPTENAVFAYEKDGENAFSSIDVCGQISDDGYFMAYGAVYAESTGEMQITVKYNDSLTEEYIPGADPKSFRWELEDEDGNVLSKGNVLDSAEKYQYNYIRLSFGDVKPDKNIFMKFVCEEKNYPAEDTDPHLLIYSEGDSLGKYNLSSDEKSLLTGGRK